MPDNLKDAEGFVMVPCEECGGEGTVPHEHDKYCEDDCDPSEQDSCEECDGDSYTEIASEYDLESLIEDLHDEDQNPAHTAVSIMEICWSNNIPLSEYEVEVLVEAAYEWRKPLIRRNAKFVRPITMTAARKDLKPLPSMSDCIAAGTHMLRCTADGYCKVCFQRNDADMATLVSVTPIAANAKIVTKK
jgi:hypothetical protein